MKPVVVYPFYNHSNLVCEESKQMLRDAGFEVIGNDTGKRLTPDEMKDILKDAFASVAGTEKYTREILESAANLKTVIRFGVGTDNFDLECMKEKGIKVGVISNFNAVAEMTVTLILSVLKNIPSYDAAVRNITWPRYTSYELKGKTVGLLGFGRIGKRVAELLSGFSVNIIAYDPFINGREAQEREVVPRSFEDVLKESDIVSLHLPVTEKTMHIICDDTLALMKKGSYLVNTARGALVDEYTLKRALDSGRLAGAALDVFEKEPVDSEFILSETPKTVLTPHVAALTYETNFNAGITCAQSIINVFNGKDPVYPLRY